MKRELFGLGWFELNLLTMIVMRLLMYGFELNSKFVALGNDDKACDFCYSNPSFCVGFFVSCLYHWGLKVKAG